MANVYDQAIGSGSAVTIGANARTTEAGTIGVPAIQWIKVASNGIEANYTDDNSVWSQATAVMQSMGYQIIYAPAPASGACAYMVDANLSPNRSFSTGVAGNIKDPLDAINGVSATVTNIALTGVGFA